jgi:lysozyme
MKVSREGVVLIKSFVGFRSKAVRGEDGRWLIGYGHTASAREGLTVAEPDAELLLQYDLLPVVQGINRGVDHPINQHQFDALASFALSIGVDRFLGSDVLQHLNAGLPVAAADALMGWPAPVPVDAATRRRVAERALFNADPDRPVHLADLLTAPLAPIETGPVPSQTRPQVASVTARAAALATLLGEPVIERPRADEDTTTDITVTVGEPEQATPAPAPEPVAATPSPVASGTGTGILPAMQFQRYSPYAAGILGPLPGLVTTPVPAQAVSFSLAVIPEQATVEAGPVEPTVPDTGVAEPAMPEPDAPEAVQDSDHQPESLQVEVAPPEATPPDPVVVAFETVTAVTVAAPPLVLTASLDEPAVDDRPVWPEAQRQDPVPDEDQEPLFGEEPVLSVLRHEIEPTAPARFEKSSTGAFLIMGGVGLLASGFSAAAFRLALEEPSPMGETTVVAWTLAVIGGVCVVVSSLNLYMRWGRTERG